jgi:hypothetical protein
LLQLYFTAIALQAVGMMPVPVRIAPKPNGSLTKYALIEAWQATTDLAVIKEMFSSMETYANAIGLATGGGLFVLDLDCKNGLNGRAALAALEKENSPLPVDTPRALTMSGGEHIYLRHPMDMVVSNSESLLAQAVDVRGAGGFVIVPQSSYEGNNCSWLFDPWSYPQPWLQDGCSTVLSSIRVQPCKYWQTTAEET